MRKGFIYIIVLFCALNGVAQVGVNNPNPAVSSILDLTSFDKGFLMPRMTTQRRQTISSPAEGLTVYDTDDAMFYFYDSTYSGTGNQKWTGISPFLLRDDDSFPQLIVGGKSDGGDTTINFNNIYTHEAVRHVGIGTVSPLNTLSVNGNLSIGDDFKIAPINGLYAKGNIEADTLKVNVVEGYGTVPVGTVVMWTGITAPDGWQICDGANIIDSESPISGTPTPNLSGRFIVGTGKSDDGPATYSLDDDGGEQTHVLSIAEMPSHDHDGVTNTDGSHAHRFNDVYSKGTQSVTQAGCIGCGTRTVSNEQGETQESTTKSGDGSHFHAINPEGNGDPHEDRPPYYALAYIVRIK